VQSAVAGSLRIWRWFPGRPRGRGRRAEQPVLEARLLVAAGPGVGTQRAPTKALQASAARDCSVDTLVPRRRPRRPSSPWGRPSSAWKCFEFGVLAPIPSTQRQCSWNQTRSFGGMRVTFVPGCNVPAQLVPLLRVCGQVGPRRGAAASVARRAMVAGAWARAPGSGDPGVTRTRDLRFRKPPLYPPELRGPGRSRCSGPNPGPSQGVCWKWRRRQGPVPSSPG